MTIQHAYNITKIRQNFPILSENVNGFALAYLDNAATTQKPHSVIEAIQYYYKHQNSNVHRGVHTLSEIATKAYENARETVQKFIHATSANEIIFVRGTTEAINLVAQSFCRPRFKAGDEIIVSLMEHHSNIVPWQIICEQTGARLRVVPINEAGELDLEAYQNLFNDRTKMVALTHVSNALGTINPIKLLIKIAHDHQVPILIDGAQAVPHMPVDVADLDCDFYAFSGHKMYGPTGIGVLHAKYEHLNSMPPYQGGGDMILKVSFEEGTTYNQIPYKFEAGTPNIAGAIGLAAAIDYLNEIGLTSISKYENNLLSYATEAMKTIPYIRFIGTASEKSSVISFMLDGIHPHDIGTILDQQGIAIRTGHHCAMPLMDHYGLAATARASLGIYNTHEEIDRLVKGLESVRAMFGLA